MPRSSGRPRRAGSSTCYSPTLPPAREHMARDYERILLLARPSIGDVLLGTPLLHALRTRWPESVVDVLIYAGHEQILEGNPDVDEVIAVGKHPSFREYREQLDRTSDA